MNDKELEELVNKHPLLMNAVFPCVIIATAMITMFGAMSLIQWML